eukprot:Skav221223  [mRNA]  locus=scaffold2467:265228:265548:- [translate_table: standard]
MLHILLLLRLDRCEAYTFLRQPFGLDDRAVSDCLSAVSIEPKQLLDTAFSSTLLRSFRCFALLVPHDTTLGIPWAAGWNNLRRSDSDAELKWKLMMPRYRVFAEFL